MQRTSRYDTSSAPLGMTTISAPLGMTTSSAPLGMTTSSAPLGATPAAHTLKALLQLVRYHYTANIACNIARTSTSEASGKTPKRLTNLSLSTALS